MRWLLLSLLRPLFLSKLKNKFTSLSRGFPILLLVDIVFIHISYIIHFILINIFEIFLWYSKRMKLIVYQICAKTMSVTGGVLESLSRQVKKQCFFRFTLWLQHSDIIIFLHIYTTKRERERKGKREKKEREREREREKKKESTRARARMFKS